jgi:hypothetical protein
MRMEGMRFGRGGSKTHRKGPRTMEVTLYRVIRADGVETEVMCGLIKAQRILEISPAGSCLMAERYVYSDSECLGHKETHDGCGQDELT